MDGDVRFLCDAMLGGLARWLRAAGYDAAFEHGIDDAALVARAAATGEVVLSSDRPLFERRPFRTGEARGLFVPRHRPLLDQATFVLAALGLAVRDPRCMRCGGALVETSRASVVGEAPPRTIATTDAYWRCGRCGHLYWHGTHWRRIEATLDALRASVSAARSATE